MTFLLVITVYSVAVGEPSFGIMGPLVIGASLFAAALTGGGFTGAALNPARVLGTFSTGLSYSHKFVLSHKAMVSWCHGVMASWCHGVVLCCHIRSVLLRT